MANTGAPGTFPLQDYPIADDQGKVTLAWSRWFTTVWNLLGGQAVPGDNPVALRQTAPSTLSVYNAGTGQLIGTVQLDGVPGGAPVPVAAGASPQIYTATDNGFLVVFAAAVELSRDSGVTWYQVTLNGGAVPMLPEDQVRLTWYNQAPKITWFPN